MHRNVPVKLFHGKQALALLFCFDQRIKQHQLVLLSSREIVRRSFGNVAKRSRFERDPAAIDAQSAAAFEHVTNDVLVDVAYLLRVCVRSGAEYDES